MVLMAQGIGNPENRLELCRAVNLRVTAEHSKHAVLLLQHLWAVVWENTLQCACSLSSMVCSQTMARQDITGGLSESLCTSGKTGVSFVDNTANQCVAQDQLHTEPISNSKCQGAGDHRIRSTWL